MDDVVEAVAGMDDKTDKLATPARRWRLSRLGWMCWEGVSRIAQGVNVLCLQIASLFAGLCRTGTIACILTL